MALNMSNGNPLANAVNKARRKLVLNHIWKNNVVIYRKVSTKPDEDSDPTNPQTLGGAMIIGGIEDSADYEFDLIGAGVMVHVSQYGGASWAGDGVTFNTENSVPVLIEPVIENEFEVKKHDRVALILPNFHIMYQVAGVKSLHSLPQGRSQVIFLQPLETEANPDYSSMR